MQSINSVMMTHKLILYTVHSCGLILVLNRSTVRNTRNKVDSRYIPAL